MQNYSTTLEQLSKLVQDPSASVDPTQELLLNLARAYAALERLNEMGADLKLQGRPLVLPSLEKAYREALYVRGFVPVDWLDISLISRFGRIVDGSSKV